MLPLFHKELEHFTLHLILNIHVFSTFNCNLILSTGIPVHLYKYHSVDNLLLFQDKTFRSVSFIYLLSSMIIGDKTEYKIQFKVLKVLLQGVKHIEFILFFCYPLETN